MGRGLVFICTGMVFIFGIIQLGISNRHNMESGINIEYASWVQARNVAASGAEVAVMELISDKNWNDPQQLHINGYTANVALLSYLDDPGIAADQIRVVSVSSIGNRSATVSMILQERGRLPDIEGAIGIYSNELDFRVTGGAFVIDGTDGETDPANMKYGIAAGNKIVYDELMAKLSQGQKDNVIGLGGGSSIGQVRDRNEELIEIVQWYREIAQTPGLGTYHDGSESFTGNERYGTTDSLQVTYVANTMRVTGNVEGAGILIVDNLDLRGGGGGLNFEGLVIVLGKANIAGNISVNGAMLFGGEKPVIDIDFRGNFNIAYSSSALEGIEPYLSGSDMPPVDLPFEMVSMFE